MAWWRRALFALVGATVFGACADFEGEPAAPATPEAGADGSTADAPDAVVVEDGGDAGIPPIVCDKNKEFGTPLAFGSLGAGVGNRDSAWIVAGGAFTTELSAEGSDVLYGPFVDDRPSALVHVSLTEAGGTLRNTSWLTTPDGKTGFFVGTSKESKIGIWRATLQAGPTPSFGDAVMIVNKSTVYSATVRGRTLLYADQEPNRGYELHLAALDAKGEVFTDDKLTLLNTTFNDAAAVMTADGLRLYWGSDRPDDNASGNWDIWTATRAATTAQFSNPRRVAELNTPGLEIPTWISDDECTMLISSTRGRPGANGADIFIARRPL